MPAALPYIAVAIAAGGAVEANVQQRHAAAREQERYRLEQRAAEIANTRARRQAISQAQEQQASIQAAAVARGAAGGSSGAQGESSSVGSQLASNIGFASTETQLSSQASEAGNTANQDLGRAATFQAIGNLPGQLGIQPKWSFQN